jgi:hypothetical protein
VADLLDVVVGIDQARECGYAVLDLDGLRVDSGTWTLAKAKDDPRSVGARYDALIGNVAALVRWCERRQMIVRAIAYEDVGAQAMRSLTNMRQLNGYIAAVEIAAHRAFVRTVPVATPTVKKTAGRGGATKEYMIWAAEDRWDQDMADDNEADALWTAEAARLKLIDEGPAWLKAT